MRTGRIVSRTRKSLPIPSSLVWIGTTSSTVSSFIFGIDSKFLSEPHFSSLKNHSSATPPFVPELKGPDDTTYFEDEELPDLPAGFHMKHKKQGFSGENFPFVGYSFTRSLGIFSSLFDCLLYLLLSYSPTPLGMLCRHIC